MKRSAVYAHASSNRCDWCGCDLPRARFDERSAVPPFGANHRTVRIQGASDGSIVKFVSPIDGNYVRARLCPLHLEKIGQLMESGA